MCNVNEESELRCKHIQQDIALLQPFAEANLAPYDRRLDWSSCRSSPALLVPSQSRTFTQPYEGQCIFEILRESIVMVASRVVCRRSQFVVWLAPEGRSR